MTDFDTVRAIQNLKPDEVQYNMCGEPVLPLSLGVGAEFWSVRKQAAELQKKLEARVLKISKNDAIIKRLALDISLLRNREDVLHDLHQARLKVFAKHTKRWANRKGT